MIEKLTKKQIGKFKYYCEKWLKVGLSTEEADKQRAEEGICALYELAGLDKPEFVWLNSPYAVQLYINILKKFKGIELAQARAQVRDQVWDQVRAQVWAQVRDSKMEYYNNYFCSQAYAGYFGFYDFMKIELKVNINKKTEKSFLKERQITESLFWWYAFKNLVICVNRPQEINLVDGRLHKDGGPSILFRDGWSIWSLNGIRVPQWLAETPANKIDPQLVMKEQNVEIRREILRKIGVERYINKIGASYIDTFKDRLGNEYQLLEFALPGKKGRALKMKNPSLKGVYHIEGVPTEINTCEEALNWRNQANELPIKLS